MKVVFFGSSGFSVPPLQAIQKVVTWVVTRKAKPKGRGYNLEDTEVKKEAERLGLPVLEIDSFKDDAARELAAMKPSLFVVASFGLIIPRWALDIPSMGSLNIHPSLLPRYRGPSPIPWALWNGDEQTGITFIAMNEKMDAGDILYQEAMVIEPEDDAVSLSERLSRRSAEILPNFLNEIEAHGLPHGQPQNHEQATFTPILTKGMGKIDWQKSADDIVRQVKALVAWPTAYTSLDGLFLKIYKGRSQQEGLVDNPPAAGTILEVTREGISVQTGSGAFIIHELQLQNKKRMRAYDFAQGYRKLAGRILE